MVTVVMNCQLPNATQAAQSCQTKQIFSRYAAIEQR